jgi:hypothetical protein
MPNLYPSRTVRLKPAWHITNTLTSNIHLIRQNGRPLEITRVPTSNPRVIHRHRNMTSAPRTTCRRDESGQSSVDRRARFLTLEALWPQARWWSPLTNCNHGNERQRQIKEVNNRSTAFKKCTLPTPQPAQPSLFTWSFNQSCSCSPDDGHNYARNMLRLI